MQVKHMTNAHQTFYVLVPENVKKEDFKINFCFTNMSDVMKGKVFTGRSCVAATNRLGHKDLPLCLIQMERPHGSEHPFEEQRDRSAF